MLPSNKLMCCVSLVSKLIFSLKYTKMNGYKEPYWKSNENLNINLTPRSDQTSLVITCNRNRPCSAACSCKTLFDNKVKFSRPRSAEFLKVIPTRVGSFQSLAIPNENNFAADSPLTVSRFTDSSSKFLQNLLETTNQKLQALQNKSFPDDKLLASSDCQLKIKENCLLLDNNIDFSKDHYVSESLLLRDKNISVKENLPEVVEEKTVRFSEEQLLLKKESSKTVTCFNNDENFSSCLKNKFKTSCPETYEKWKKICNQEKEQSPKTASLNDKKENIVAKVYSSETETETSSGKNEREILLEKWCKRLKERKPSDEFEEAIENSSSVAGENSEGIVCEKLENVCSERFEKPTSFSDEKIQECNRCFEEVQVSKKYDCDNQKTEQMDSTYEEIVQLLQTLDEEDSESVNLENKQDLLLENPAAVSDEKIDYFSAVSSYLEEVERNDNDFHDNNVKNEKYSSEHFTSPRLEQLLNKSSVELAHEVFSLKIQIEDQKKGIKLLKDTLKEMKEAKKIEELEHQEALQKAGAEAEALVQRHQKFIKQLLNEKKNLNETVSKLVQDLKSGEERYKRNLRAMEEKHAIEVKRAKEAQAVADKIKREKWMESKTQKIKEMTVKGLEPELSRMAARQQEELTELRNLHKAELEAVELRAARRTSELMDELRAELTKEKERAIAKEITTLRSSMEKDFEDERNKLQQYCQTLKDRIRKLEEKLSNQEFEFQQRLLDLRQEEEKKKQKIIRENQENLEEVRRQHLVVIEIRNLKESAESEKEVALNNYKKLQAVKLNEREAELHQQYKKERDREIEIVIETLEKESTQAQQELNIANEGKLKRLKDKMVAEIKELEASEAVLKEKLSETKSKLSEKEDIIAELNSSLRQQQTELTFLKKSCDEMSKEKAKIKEIIREEFKSSMNDLAKEKENLEREIVVLKELHLKELAKKDDACAQAKHEMQKELTKVYSRIKSAVNKKEKIIESLREEIEVTNKKLRQLEFMLDQQRRNLLLQ